MPVLGLDPFGELITKSAVMNTPRSDQEIGLTAMPLRLCSLMFSPSHSLACS